MPDASSAHEMEKSAPPHDAQPRLGSAIERDVPFDPAICKDRIRYKLVPRGGRYFFDKVVISDAEACGSGLSHFLKQRVEGRFLDEIDLQELEEFYCRGGGAKSCYQAMADILRDLKEALGETGSAP